MKRRGTRATAGVALAGLLVTVIMGPLSSVATAATGTLTPTGNGFESCSNAPKPSPLLTATQVQTLRQEIIVESRGNGTGFGLCTGGPVVVTLRPGREWLAQRLTTTYGTKVVVNIVGVHWTGHPTRSQNCGDLPKPKATPKGLTIRYIPRATSVTSGSVFAGTVRFTNAGPGTGSATYGGGSFVAKIVRPGTRDVVGVFSGARTDTLRFVTVSPGQSEMAPVIGGTERCDGGVGSALPPGKYDVVVPIDKYLTPPVPIRVTTYHHPKG